MIQHLVPLAAIALAGFANPQAPTPTPSPSPSPSPTEAPDRISYAGTGNGWSGGQTSWWIDRSGRGAYRTTIRVEMDSKFNAGPEGFERIRAILQSLEEVRELPCDGAVTDQGMGALRWRHGDQETSLRFDFGCNFRQPDPARAQLGQAAELIREWALAK